MLGNIYFVISTFALLIVVGCGDKTQMRSLMNSQVLQAGDGSTTNLDGTGSSTSDPSAMSDNPNSNSNSNNPIAQSNPSDTPPDKPRATGFPNPFPPSPDTPSPSSSPRVSDTPNPSNPPVTPPSMGNHTVEISRVCRVRTDIRSYYLGGGTPGLSPTAPKEIRFYSLSATLQRQKLISAMDLPLQIPQGYKVVVPDSLFADLTATEKSHILINVCEKTAQSGIGTIKSSTVAGCLNSGEYADVFSLASTTNFKLRISYGLITNAQLVSTSTRPAYCDEAMASPLVLDLEGNGIGLRGPSTSQGFDLFGIGTKVKSGWVRSSRDPFLALDLNRNGKIDSALELFGDATKMPNGQQAANGFEALRQYDSNGDGSIDSRDDVYSELMLWDDINHNQVSEMGELSSLESERVRSINLNYERISEMDAFGNQTLQRSLFQGSQGAGLIVDIWFIVKLR